MLLALFSTSFEPWICSILVLSIVPFWRMRAYFRGGWECADLHCVSAHLLISETKIHLFLLRIDINMPHRLLVFNPRKCTPVFITRTCRGGGGGRCDPGRFETKRRRAWRKNSGLPLKILAIGGACFDPTLIFYLVRRGLRSNFSIIDNFRFYIKSSQKL